MKKTNIEKLKKEIENQVIGKPSRYGIEYAWYNAHALDEGILTRQRNAIKWKEEVVALAEKGVVTEKRVRVRHYSWIGNVTAYYVDGELVMYRYRQRIIDNCLSEWKEMS